MAIRNLMLDIVTNAVTEVMKNDRIIKDSGTNRDDIIAYVANRVPAKYVTSERGILHGALDARYLIQQRVDILKLIYDAFHEIKARRNSQAMTKDDIEIDAIRLPHIIGTVLEETTLSIIPDVCVTLFFKNKPAAMVYDEWVNPYTTHKATMGYYHFWPRYSKKEMGRKPIFQIHYQHQKFHENTVDIELAVVESMQIVKSQVAPIAILKIKDGMSLDFLYQE